MANFVFAIFMTAYNVLLSIVVLWVFVKAKDTAERTGLGLILLSFLGSAAAMIGGIL